MTTQTASTAARRLGYAHELAALQARHRRCAKSWAPHLAHTRTALLQSAKRHAGREGSAIVLGAGLIHDIPLTELCALFGRTYLVDIAFLQQTRRLALAAGGKLELILSDLTGICDGVFGACRVPTVDSKFNPLPSSLIDKAAWVASVNCLTQLPLLPAKQLLQRGLPETDIEDFGRALMQAHLHLLNGLHQPWCLITEMGDRRFDRLDRPIGATDYGPLLRPSLAELGARQFDEWEWLVHPSGELPHGETETRAVTAWEDGINP